MYRRFGALMAALLLVFLAACGSDSGDSATEDLPTDLDELVAAAQEEGSLVWYTGTVEKTSAAVVEAFKAKYGIDVEVVRLNSADIAQRVHSEYDSGKVGSDVISISDHVVLKGLADDGVVRSLPEEYFGDIPEEFRLGDFGPVISLTKAAVNFNTEGGGVQIESWDDLLDPALKGKLIVVDPRGTGPAGVYAQFWSAVLNNPDLGEDFVRELAKQDFVVQSSALPAVEMIVAGEADAVIASSVAAILGVNAAGAKLANFLPTDPAVLYRNYAALPDGASSPNAGALFLRFLTSEEGSSVLAAAENASSPLGDIPGADPLPEGEIADIPSDEQLEKDLATVVELLGLT